MTKSIWKYELVTNGPNKPKVPIGAQFLTLQLQYGLPQIWFLVNVQGTLEERTFEIHGPGWQIQENPGEYRGTYQLAKGSLVFHVFETTGL